MFAVTHVLYTVVHIRDSVFYLDCLEVLCNYVVMEPLFLKIACPYVGNYRPTGNSCFSVSFTPTAVGLRSTSS